MKGITHQGTGILSKKKKKGDKYADTCHIPVRRTPVDFPVALAEDTPVTKNPVGAVTSDRELFLDGGLCGPGRYSPRPSHHALTAWTPLTLAQPTRRTHSQTSTVTLEPIRKAPAVPGTWSTFLSCSLPCSPSHGHHRSASVLAPSQLTGTLLDCPVLLNAQNPVLLTPQVLEEREVLFLLCLFSGEKNMSAKSPPAHRELSYQEYQP